jgi:hypothetical protein
MFSRERRIQQKTRHIKRQVNHYRHVWDDYKDNADVRQPHRLAKRNAFNCGKTRCMFCANPRKLFKERTMQERRFHKGADKDGLE